MKTDKIQDLYNYVQIQSVENEDIELEEEFQLMQTYPRRVIEDKEKSL